MDAGQSALLASSSRRLAGKGPLGAKERESAKAALQAASEAVAAAATEAQGASPLQRFRGG